MSPGTRHTRGADRELHGKSFVSEAAQQEIRALQAEHPDKRVMLIAEKGTMGVGSSRMSGGITSRFDRQGNKPLYSVRQ